MTTRALLLCVLLGTLVVAAPAAANAPFTLGVGARPHVLTDPASGAAHVVWADGDTVRYCRVPRGAAACDATAALAAGAAVEHPFLVFGNAGTIYLGLPDYIRDKVFLWRSVTGGATWSGQSQIYDWAARTDWTEPIFDETRGELVFAGWNLGRSIVGAAFDNGESMSTTRAELGDGGNGSLLYDLQVAHRPGGGYVAAANDLHNAAAWYTAPGADPSQSPQWTGPVAVGDGDTTRVASGSSGTYLLSTSGPVGARAMVVRRWSGATFAAPVTVAGEEGYMNDLTVGPSGAVAAVWRRNGSPGHLRLAVSGDGGGTWAVSSIAAEDVLYSDMDVSIAADARGWAVYEGATVSGSTKQIRLVNTDAIPEPVPAPAPVPVPTPAPVVPVKVTRDKTVTVKGATLTLTYPRQCVPAGQPFRVRLTWKKQRRKGNLFVKVRRTDFFIGAKRQKIDRKAPFSQLLRIANPRRGASYTLRARAFIKVKRGKAPTKSIKVTLKVCA